MSGFKSLLQSRKVLIALFGVVQAIVLQYLEVPDPVWQAIAGLAAVLIASIAAEDCSEKRRPN